MEDPVLNRSLEETRELQTRWNQFREFVRVSIDRGKATPEAEMKFLELKSIIAMLHDGFMAKLDHEQKTGQNIMSIVGDCIMLSRIANYNDAEKQKFEFDWNECYLLINEQLQSLEGERTRLAGVSKRAYNASRRRQMIQAKIHNFMHSSGLKYSVIAIVLFMVLYGVPAFNIYNYRNLRGIPVAGQVYQFIANRVYRAFLSSEYAYDGWDDLYAKSEAEAPDPNAPGAERIRRQSHSELNRNYLESSVLNEIGMSRQAATEAGKLLRNNLLQFESERYTADGSNDVRLFYILFTTTADARSFVDLANESLRAADLPAARRNQILDNTYMIRKANFVGIGLSTHIMRKSQILEKFRFDDSPSELRS